jgi:hypothetical protein
MRRYSKIGIFFILFVVMTCAPKLSSTVTSPYPPLEENALVVFLDITDDQFIKDEQIGRLKASDNGFSVNCTFYENKRSLIAEARKVGANLIKIVEHKYPDNWSTCHRLEAVIYRVANPKDYETRIEWSADRKLTWDDFKGKPDLENHPYALALTNSGFGYESAKTWSQTGDLFVESVFNTRESWVLPEGRNDYVLRHEQIHFDISEIYARRLRKALSDANVKAKDVTRVQQIFEEVFKEMQKRQKTYDSETYSGDKIETQKNWEAIVELELAKYALYKAN